MTVAIGSGEPSVTEQVEELRAAGFAVVEIDTRALLAGEPPARTIDGERRVIRLVGQAEAMHAALASGADPAELAAATAHVAQAFARAVAEHAGDADLVATGGATARAILDALGERRLRPLREVHAGAVVSLTPSGRLVGTRPGSFGDRRSLRSIAETVLAYRAEAADATCPRTSAPAASTSRAPAHPAPTKGAP